MAVAVSAQPSRLRLHFGVQGHLGKPQDLRSLLSPSGPPLHGRVLEPLNSASPPGLHGRHAMLMEERVAMLEQRLMAAERSASEASVQHCIVDRFAGLPGLLCFQKKSNLNNCSGINILS